MKQLVYAFLLCMALLLLPDPAQAGEVEEAIISQLQDQGFHDIEVSRTFLGRSRIKAERGDLEREIVVNPRTGVILRDYSKRIGGGASLPRLIDPSGGTSGPSSGSSEDDDDGDDGDHDDGDSDSDGDDGGDDGSDD